MIGPNFSVIIPTYLRVSALERCLLALEKQTRLPDEVIVVRRNTDVDTKNFLNFYSLKNDLRIKLILIQVDEPGYLPPVKAGFSVAGGDYVALIDDDVLVNSQWVEKAIAIMRANPQMGAINGAAVCKTKNFGSVYPARLWFGARFAMIKESNLSNNKINGLLEGNVIFRKEALSEGLIDLRLNRGRVAHHGLDIGLQLLKKGWQLAYYPVLDGEHLALQANYTIENDENIENYIRNICLIIYKNNGYFGLVWFVLYNLAIGQYFIPGLSYFLFRGKTSLSLFLISYKTLIMSLVSPR